MQIQWLASMYCDDEKRSFKVLLSYYLVIN